MQENIDTVASIIIEILQRKEPLALGEYVGGGQCVFPGGGRTRSISDREFRGLSSGSGWAMVR